MFAWEFTRLELFSSECWLLLALSGRRLDWLVLIVCFHQRLFMAINFLPLDSPPGTSSRTNKFFE